MGKSGNTPQSSFRLGADVIRQIKVIAEWMSEREYVSALYRLRDLPLPAEIAEQLNDYKPK